jgi:superfamily II DNA or RNA helicase
MMSDYQDFLANKALIDPDTGLKEISALNPHHKDFQRDLVRWALRRGRGAIWADCGLGKGLMALDWADHIPGEVLIVAPLAVSQQFKREADKFGVDVGLAKNQDEITKRITVTNYERLDGFDPSRFTGVVLDESSILKSFDGKTRTQLIETFAQTPFRLCCSATPAPNDHMELGNHAEFLGVMTRTEMLAMFFVHDGGDTSKWRIKKHAEKEFWKWICSWAVMLRKPSDLDYDDEEFKLPPIEFHSHTIDSGVAAEGMLFAMEASTLQERIGARRSSIKDRVALAAEIANDIPIKRQVLVWCNLNGESEALTKAIAGAVEVKGSDSSDHKERSIVDFISNKTRVLVSKPTIFGYGLNLQNCSDVIFVGLSDSYEQFYQAIRRCWRFGQKKQVNVHIITAKTEGAVLSNIHRKETDANRMAEGMLVNMRDINKAMIHGGTVRMKSEYERETKPGKGWTAHLGDCVEVVAEIPDDSIHYTIYSPPFASLYTYSNSDRDMGNSLDHEQFFEHYKFLLPLLYQKTMPGRLVSFHCMNMPTSKVRDGVIGLTDFRGQLIKMHQDAGFIFHSEVCIWKDPVTAMQRTKALGLLHKQLKKDACMSRQGIPDYLVTMRKPGDNPERVTNTNESFPVQVWQNYASPVWMDINPSDTLQYRSAREHNDERHICPLQLEVIRRGIKLWTNPGDTVLSPFMGIASEGYVALQMGRKFIGAELKRSYFDQAWRNLETANQLNEGLFTGKES